MNSDNSGKSLKVGCTREPSCLCSGKIWSCRVLLGLLVAVLLPSFISAQDKNSQKPAEPLAVLAGQPITEDQLPTAEQAQLQKMMQQVFAVKRRALQETLYSKLVATEAKKKGVSVDDLVKSEVDSKVANPTDEDVTAYYQAHQSQINQPFDDIKDKLRQGLKDQQIQQARQLYAQGLMQQAVNDGELVVMLLPPKVEVSADPARLRGDSKAPVTIVEFSDFSCPYCGKVESTLTELLAKYPGKVKLGYRDFPLRQIHPQAQLAAEASRCAVEQGKYWEYHDVLFANPEKQQRDDLIGYARTLKMDDKQFDACLSSGRFKPQIDQDIQLGTRLGVVATPGFFVNGIFLNGAQPAAAFEQVIDQELSASSQKTSSK
jgi:protein-disulfide isomerase